jgi:hypothetical protein
LSCSRYRQLISRYVDDEVTPRQRADLLAHVQTCHDCAAWLARARQTDVLLKGVGDTGPSDRVRSAILNEVRHLDEGRRTKDEGERTKDEGRRTKTRQRRPSSPWSGLLLRFDPSPWRIGLGLVAALFALVGLAYYLNLLPPVWGYNKLGFEYQQEGAQAMVGTTPISVSAVSSGRGGVGGPVAVPNLVNKVPVANAQAVALDTPVHIRFDQPMDRGSVEGAFSIDPPVAGTFAWDADNEVRFAPDAPGLLRGVTYTVSLSTTAASLAGTPLKDPVTWAFHTPPAHTVTFSLPAGAAIASTGTLSLLFDAPMRQVDATQIVSLHHDGTENAALPFTYTWGPGAQSLTVTPKSALADGNYYLLVQAGASTAAGDSLGQPFEFDYHVQTPGPHLRLLGNRLLLATQGKSASVGFVLEDSANSSLDGVVVDVYSLPAEWLSALGAQANQAGALPAGVLEASRLVRQIQPVSSQTTGSLALDNLSAGLYLLVAGASDPAAVTGDWKLLIVSNYGLALTGSNSPFWATNQVGRPWLGAEVSLYSPEGALLEKGLVDNAGLWSPTAASNGATLAIARDISGNLAASIVDPRTVWGQQVANSLPASLVTDLPDYRPGDTVNFHLQLDAQQGNADQDVSVLLLTPGGSTVQALSLKPDDTGSVSGVFPLSPDAQAGSYTIRVRLGNAVHDFSVAVTAAHTRGPHPGGTRGGTLSVYIVPSTDIESDGPAITRTVSVLGPTGQPQAGALITATLGIRGDSWVSKPVTAVTDGDGFATFVVPLPGWFAMYNDPGIYLEVAAQADTLLGDDRSYLDFTSQQVALSGMTQLISPDRNVAVIARPSPDGNYIVRVVLVDQQSKGGDILVQAAAPDGETLNYSLDMARLLDATINVPQSYGGGSLTIRAAGEGGARVLPLMPMQEVHTQGVPGAAPDAHLQVTVPFTVTAGASVPVGLVLTTTNGVGPGGTASIWMRPVSGESSERALVWQPALSLDVSGTLTTNIQAPNSPGLWYVMASAADTAGDRAVSWDVVRVLPGPWVQLSPAIEGKAGDQQAFSVSIYNPTGDPLSSRLSATTRGGAQVAGNSVQAVNVNPGDWERLDWSVLSNKAGSGGVDFSFTPDAGVNGSWALDVPAEPNPSLDTTYTAGVLTGERNVGVAVPWGLSGDSIRLEIRASTSLLPALSAIATDLQSSDPGATEGVSMAAARLGAPFSVATAYTRLGSRPPDGLELSGVDYSLILQQIYSAQHADGAWGSTLDGAGADSIRETAEVLLAMHRAQTYNADGAGRRTELPAPDLVAVSRALDYLSSELARPVRASQSSDALDERAFGLYVLSLYRAVPMELVRPMLAYAASSSGGPTLSVDGQAWLALGLWQAGNSADATALLDHLLATEQLATQPSLVTPLSAPMLEALVVALQSLPANGYRSKDLPDYAGQARLYMRALMEARQGAGWRTPSITADALAALSHFAVATGESPQSGDTAPNLVLGDRPVQADAIPGNSGTISVVLSGAELRPGTNWLTLKPSATGQPLYYSLTLIAKK